MNSEKKPLFQFEIIPGQLLTIHGIVFPYFVLKDAIDDFFITFKNLRQDELLKKHFDSIERFRDVIYLFLYNLL